MKTLNRAPARALSGYQAIGSQPLQSKAAMGTNLPESSAVIERVTCASVLAACGTRCACAGARLRNLLHRDVRLRAGGCRVSTAQRPRGISASRRGRGAPGA